MREVKIYFCQFFFWFPNTMKWNDFIGECPWSNVGVLKIHELIFMLVKYIIFYYK